MRFRFKIADLMILVVPAAAFSYAAANDKELLPHLAFAAYLVLLAVATMGAKFARGDKGYKAFWKGTAIFGWVYLVFGLYFGVVQSPDGALLTRSIVGLTFALLAGYVTRRLVPRILPPRDGKAEATGAGSGS